jgi:glycosyltransferase involved in cell wall biosynthesis
MKLSIIIPVYNVVDWLPETVDSVLAQSFRDFELILVDDGATDGSGEICDSYAARDARVRVIHQKNAGVSAARNTGVAAAKGDYIGFTDSDDIIEKDMYAVMMSLAEKHNADVVQCQHDRANTLNEALRQDDSVVMTGEEFVRRMFTKTGSDYTNQVSLCTTIMKRSLFENVVFPVGQVYEDEQETYKLCLKAVRLAETNDILYHYIKRENSIITGVSARKRLDKQQALADRLHYLPERVPELEKQCCESFMRYSEGMLCQLYEAQEAQSVDCGLQVLKLEKKRLKPYMSRYERLYFALLPRCKKWILGNEFAPIQNWVSKLRKNI